MSDFLAEIALTTPCPRCKAEPGDRCLTSSGNRSRDPHVARMRPLWDAFYEGFDYGRDDILDALDKGWDGYIAAARHDRDKRREAGR